MVIVVGTSVGVTARLAVKPTPITGVNCGATTDLTFQRSGAQKEVVVTKRVVRFIFWTGVFLAFVLGPYIVGGLLGVKPQ